MTSLFFLLAFLISCSPSEGKGPGDCADGLTRCDGACVDLQVDDQHCGACGAACGESQTCEFGRCTDDPCPEGRTMCDGRCVDLKNNIRHCGECDNACGEEEVCLGGVCGQSCGPGQDVCDGACVDTQNDPAHCGACGKPCEDGALCSRGKCVEECDDGLITCGSSCVDDRSDPRNCGGCGFACEAGLACVNGHCSCPEGQSDCKGVCIDLSTDPDNCGACGEVCPSEGAPHASKGQCRNSTCELTCNPGRGNCNGKASDGCETDILSDSANCGGCGIDCEAGPHVSGARCTGGGCLITVCDHGWWDVNGDHEDGCEVNTLSHPEHCGLGGTQGTLVDCTRIAHVIDGTCDDGRCTYQCAENWGDCDGIASNGCETDLRDDMDHCGACNNACDPGGACVDGSCLPDTEIPNWPLPPESPWDYTVPEKPDDVSVTDNVTGLVWERQALESTHKWEDAFSYCNRLSLEGKTWRLPTVAELLTIVDSSRTNPAINTSDFKGTAGVQYWTATEQHNSTTSAWYVNFSNGATGTATKTTAYRVRCVRAGKNERGVRFTLSPDEKTVTDNKTGLVWEREPIGTSFTWANAPANCTTLGAGWRLPTKKELESLVDRRKASPTIDADFFKNVTGTYFWTSTESGSSAWRVYFSNGTSSTTSKTGSMRVICVRNP